jgi:hypothetical protein
VAGFVPVEVVVPVAAVAAAACAVVAAEVAAAVAAAEVEAVVEVAVGVEAAAVVAADGRFGGQIVLTEGRTRASSRGRPSGLPSMWDYCQQVWRVKS